MTLQGPSKKLRLALVASFARLSIRDWSFRLAQKLEARSVLVGFTNHSWSES